MPQPSASPDSLLLVRSTLEVAALLKSVYPAFASHVDELERQVREAGQLLLDAGSVARARLALEKIHEVRLALQDLRMEPQTERLAA